MSEIAEKICENCGNVFYPSKNDVRIKYCCRKCTLEAREKNGYMQSYYNENKDKWEERQKTEEYKKEKNRKRRERYANDAEYRAKHINEVRDYAARNPEKKLSQRLRKFGITIDDYKTILLRQDGKCAICGSEIGDGMGNRLYVDHNHITGKVRGLLCSECNLGLGKFKDDVSILKKAIEYLEDNNESGGNMVRP